jgi:hypothetical protein
MTYDNHLGTITLIIFLLLHYHNKVPSPFVQVTSENTLAVLISHSPYSTRALPSLHYSNTSYMDIIAMPLSLALYVCPLLQTDWLNSDQDQLERGISCNYQRFNFFSLICGEQYSSLKQLYSSW